MIIVDTNIICYLFIPGEFSSVADQVFSKNSSWYAPLLWRFEFQAVLLKYLRGGLLNLSQAGEIIEKAQSLFVGREILPSADFVLELSLKSGCSSYDCQYVAAAKTHKTVLITSDKQILKKFPSLAFSPQNFVGLK